MTRYAVQLKRVMALVTNESQLALEGQEWELEGGKEVRDHVMGPTGVCACSKPLTGRDGCRRP